MSVILDSVQASRIIRFSIIQRALCDFIRLCFLIRMGHLCIEIQTLHSMGQITLRSSGGSSFSFIGSVLANCVNDRLVMGTPAILADLVEPDIQFTPTYSKRSRLVPGITFSPSHPGGSLSAVKVIGNLFYLGYEGRNGEVRCKYFPLSNREPYLFSRTSTIRIPILRMFTTP